jgi:hypothetical protein
MMVGLRGCTVSMKRTVSPPKSITIEWVRAPSPSAACYAVAPRALRACASSVKDSIPLAVSGCWSIW